MLAQSFKTAKELNITDDQYSALQKTLVWFETGKITHQPKRPKIFDRDLNRVCQYMDAGVGRLPEMKPAKFNLGLWIASGDECGTVACIGGTASILGNVLFTYWADHKGLCALFNPQGITHDKVSVDQAARALRNFLQTGHASWHKAMKGSY